MASVARYCCCGGCPSTLQVVFSGVDAAACTGCYNDGTDSGGKWTGVSIDGTVTVSFFADYGSYCLYLYQDQSTAGTGEYHNSVTDCSSLSQNPIVVPQTTVHYVQSSNTVTLVSVGNFNDGFYWTGSATLGNAVSNQLACGTKISGAGRWPASSGGTATVS